MNAQSETAAPAVSAGGTELALISTAIAEFDKVAAGLAALQKQYGGVIYDVKTSEGMDAARKARAAVRQPRLDIETIRQDAKAPILKLGRALDAEARRITDAVKAIEDPIALQITNEEQRIEAEKRAKAKAEERRVNAIRTQIDAIERLPNELFGKDADTLRAELERLRLRYNDDGQVALFAEFYRQAGETMTRAITRLADMLKARTQADQRAEQQRIEAERLAREREELARQKAEQDRLAAEAAEAVRVRREQDAAEQRTRALRTAGINAVVLAPSLAVGKDVNYLRSTMVEIASVGFSEAAYGDQWQEGARAQMTALDQLQTLLEARIAADEQAAALQRERQESAQRAADLDMREKALEGTSQGPGQVGIPAPEAPTATEAIRALIEDGTPMPLQAMLPTAEDIVVELMGHFCMERTEVLQALRTIDWDEFE
jgi:hypothetical protein